MIIFPMRNGIRSIRIDHAESMMRSRCADAAQKLRLEQNWSERALRLYTLHGLIEAAR